MDDLPRILALYESGQLAEADALCADLMAREPGSAAGLAMRGSIALKQARYPAAVGYLQSAAALHPDDAELQTNLGMAFFGAGRIEEALRTFKSLVKRDSHNAV